MIFQRKVDRAMRYQKERNEQADIKKPTEEDKDKLSKKDLLAMILSAGLVILPVAAPRPPRHRFRLPTSSLLPLTSFPRLRNPVIPSGMTGLFVLCISFQNLL